MFCFCLFVRCFFKENFANLLFFSWAQIILSLTINYEGKHKKSKQQNSKHVSNALIWVLKLLLSFVVLLFLIIILSVIYWPQQKEKKKKFINHGRLFEIFTVLLQVHVSICEIFSFLWRQPRRKWKQQKRKVQKDSVLK